ncbi:MAG TPA: ATP-dependent protease ATPase subunit HslU [Chloroflexota bacterium]
MADLNPKQIAAELDRFIVGQSEAKRALALALRERERRKRLSPEERAEIGSKNILVIGPTGVGKTELARRLARLVDAPFLKTEATKFTEVGYVGRDVESIVRDLADASISMVHRERMTEVRKEAEQRATERIVNYLLDSGKETESETETRPAASERAYMKRRRRAVSQQLADHELEERVIEIEVDGEETYGSVLEFVSGIGSDEIHEQFQEFMNNVNMARKRSRRVSVREARRILADQEAGKLIDWEEVVETALRRVEDDGVVFLDELDKLITRNGDFGGDVSGEGVQRDLLPIVEGAGVATRYGMVNTDHILFVAAGAFNRARPSDLLPELQGRFPIRVEVRDLSEEDFVRILTEPENALTKQYSALLRTEEIDLQFTEDGIREIARFAAALNGRAENLGARRLYGVMERVVDEVSFRSDEFAGQKVVIDGAYVRTRMAGVPLSDEASKYIL